MSSSLKSGIGFTERFQDRSKIMHCNASELPELAVLQKYTRLHHWRIPERRKVKPGWYVYWQDEGFAPVKVSTRVTCSIEAQFPACWREWSWVLIKGHWTSPGTDGCVFTRMSTVLGLYEGVVPSIDTGTLNESSYWWLCVHEEVHGSQPVGGSGPEYWYRNTEWVLVLMAVCSRGGPQVSACRREWSRVLIQEYSMSPCTDGCVFTRRSTVLNLLEGVVPSIDTGTLNKPWYWWLCVHEEVRSSLPVWGSGPEYWYRDTEWALVLMAVCSLGGPQFSACMREWCQVLIQEHWMSPRTDGCVFTRRSMVLSLLDGVVPSIDTGTLNESSYWWLCLHEEVHGSQPVWGSGPKYWYRNTEWVLVLMAVCSQGGPRFLACQREWSQVLIQEHWMSPRTDGCVFMRRSTVLSLSEGVVPSIDTGILNESLYWWRCVHEEVHGSQPVGGSGPEYWYRNTEWVLVLMAVCSRGGPQVSACRREWSRVLIQEYSMSPRTDGCVFTRRSTVLNLLEGVVPSIDTGTLNKPWYWWLCVHEEVRSSLPVWGSGPEYWYRDTEWALVLMAVCSLGGPQFSACRREWSWVLIQGHWMSPGTDGCVFMRRSTVLCL